MLKANKIKGKYYKYFAITKYIQHIFCITFITICVWLFIVLIAYITRA